MKRALLILLLILITTLPALAGPTNTSGPWGVDAGGFKNLSTALASPSTVGKTLVVSKPMAINNKTVNGNREIKVVAGGRIDPGIGKTVVFALDSSFDAGLNKVFGDNGAVTGLAWARPEWTGVVADGITDYSVAYRRALSMLRPGGTLKHQLKTYVIGGVDIAGSGGISPGTTGPTIEGGKDGSTTSASNNGTVIKAPAGATYVYKVGTATNFVLRAKFQNLTIDGTSKASGGVWLAGSAYPHFDHVTFTACSYGLGLTYFDRMTTFKTNFYGNTYGYYYDSTVFTGLTAGSAVSLIDNHHRSNDYNLYLRGDRTSYQLSVRGGYWSSANIADIYVTGALSQAVFDNVNFENTSSNGSNATKPAYFQIGQITSGNHIGIDALTFINCDFFDNNAIADRPILMNVVDSTDVTKPSIRQLAFAFNRITQMSTAPLINASTGLSSIGRGYWFANSAPTVAPPTASQQWPVTQTASGAGSGVASTYNAYLYSPVAVENVFNSGSTSGFTARISESGGRYTNEGVGGIKTYTLPAVVVGYNWRFTCLSAGQAIRIDPAADEGFIGGSGLGKYIQLSTAIGDTVEVIGVSTTKGSAWLPLVRRGTITNE